MITRTALHMGIKLAGVRDCGGMQPLSVLQRRAISLLAGVCKIYSMCFLSFAFPVFSPRPLLRKVPQFEKAPSAICHYTLPEVSGVRENLPAGWEKYAR